MSNRTGFSVCFASVTIAVVVFVPSYYRLEPVVMAVDPVDEEIEIRPPTGVGSGSGSFSDLDNAIDGSPYTGSSGSVTVRCNITCESELESSAVWQGFPDGFEPLRLEVSWDAGTDREHS